MTNLGRRLERLEARRRTDQGDEMPLEERRARVGRIIAALRARAEAREARIAAGEAVEPEPEDNDFRERRARLLEILDRLRERARLAGVEG